MGRARFYVHAGKQSKAKQGDQQPTFFSDLRFLFLCLFCFKHLFPAQWAGSDAIPQTRTHTAEAPPQPAFTCTRIHCRPSSHALYHFQAAAATNETQPHPVNIPINAKLTNPHHPINHPTITNPLSHHTTHTPRLLAHFPRPPPDGALDLLRLHGLVPRRHHEVTRGQEGEALCMIDLIEPAGIRGQTAGAEWSGLVYRST